MARASFPASENEETKSLSQLLRELTDRPSEALLVDEMVDHFGRRAFGAVLFIFAVPNLLPLPPGSSTVLGLPLVLVAPQLMLGVPNLWLPRMVGRRGVRRSDMAAVMHRLLPYVVRVERLLAPRLDWVFGPIGDRLIGLVCTILAIILVLPIPLGNMLPALAIATLAIGLTQRDGVMALLGYLFTGVSIAVLALTFGAVVAATAKVLQIFGA